MDTLIWLIAFVILLVIEILTMGLTTIWFAGGALVAFVMSFLKVSVPIQILAFVIVSIALLILTRPIAVKFFNQKREKTNIDTLIGERAIVIEAIDTLHGKGRVEMNGMEWAAREAQAGCGIAVGDVVVVEAIQGVKLIVRKAED